MRPKDFRIRFLPVNDCEPLTGAMDVCAMMLLCAGEVRAYAVRGHAAAAPRVRFLRPPSARNGCRYCGDAVPRDAGIVAFAAIAKARLRSIGGRLIEPRR